MKPVRRLCALLALLSCLPLAAHAADARVIVKYKQGSDLLRKQAQSADQLPALRAQALGQRTGLALRSGLAVSERAQVVFASGLSSEALAARLAAERDVEYAVPDRRKRAAAVPNDPLYVPSVSLPDGPDVGQWYLKAPTTTVRSSINVEPAWNATTGNPNVVVAVLDTGVRRDHPELVPNLLSGYDMVSDLDIANDGNLRDGDPSDPGDWITLQETTTPGGPFEGCSVDENGDPIESYSSWHGTSVSGLVAAATNNGAGMASVGRNVKVLPVRVLGKCGGFDRDIIVGMRWAAGIAVPGLPLNPNPAKVINLSLGGGSGCSAAYVDVVQEILARGTSIVVSAGNGAGGTVAEPAGCAGVVAVAGLRHVGSKSGFSDLGSQVSISGPAGNCVNDVGPCLYPILSTTNSGLRMPISDAAGGSIFSDSRYPTLGTSFSAPLVSGALALMYSVRPALLPAEARQLIQATSRPFPVTGFGAGVAECTAPQFDESDNPVAQEECVCTSGTCGAGMLDVGAAVTAANAGTYTLRSRAQIDVPPQALFAGERVQLDGSSSEAAVGRTLTQYQWSLVDGGGIVSSISDPASAVARVTPSSAGRFKVRLTVTDSTAMRSSTDLTVVVVDGAGPPPAGGGGGALNLGWLLLLGLATLALRRAPQ
ncbi:MAG: S8 family serine peptidase [Piscinibacter sp.]|uniref:S8 family serine peptidase n=1 Tax=Piscinibacter sp. TaxID=1903157 RepID=UPI00258972B9|nr:S8 family serine peptidase [Piscinibacter sp.]MCW5665430.1 S8 family serine peptidase [Piscinibacter sp.]